MKYILAILLGVIIGGSVAYTVAPDYQTSRESDLRLFERITAVLPQK